MHPKSPIYLETAVTTKDCWTHLLQHGINVGKNTPPTAPDVAHTEV